MPARFRKSINLGGGLKLNVNKKSMSLSAGTKGAHYTISSTGRRTTSVGVPGTGASYRSTTGGGKRTAAPARARAGRPASGVAAAPARVKPGLFAPKGEKVLFRAVQVATARGPSASWMGLFDQAVTFPAQALSAHTVAGLFSVQSAPDYALGHLSAAFSTGAAPEREKFIIKYVQAVGMQLSFSGVEVAVPLSRELIGLLLSQLHENRGEIEAALTVLTALPVTPLVRLERAEVAVLAGHPDRAVALTDGMTNTDDITALTLAMRAGALRALGHLEAALEVTKEALRYPSRAAAARHRARLERGRIYAALDQPGKARAEFEKVLADDSTYPGVAEALAELTST